MSARATWKGLLKISLVTIPIKVFPATESSETISFNQLHSVCQTRMHQRKWCASCGREVPNDEVVKGFEFEKGRYVLLLPEELDAVQPPSTKIIDLVQFADADTLDPIAIDRSYYLAPDGPRAAVAFAVISEALSGKIGVGKLAIYGREYLVAVRVSSALLPALVLHTLHHAGEMRPADMVDDVPSKVPIEQVRLARQIMMRLESGPLNLAPFTDQYQVDVRRLIDAKVAGHEIVEPPPIDAPPILNLREALTQSLLAVNAARKTPAKATTTTPTKKRAS